MMKNWIYPAAAAIIVAASAFTLVEQRSWTIEDGYEIKFTSDDPTGVFTAMAGDIVFDENDLENSYFKVKVDVSSINTGNGMQNKHAVSENWFDAEKYPHIGFASRDIEKTDKGFVAHGTLSIHGVEKEMDLPFKFVGASGKGVFKSKFQVNRTDFNLGDPGNKASHVLQMEVTVPVSGK